MSSDTVQSDARPSFPLGMLAESIASFGGLVIELVAALGEITIFSGRTLSWLVSRRPARGTLLFCAYEIGVLSLPVIALTGTFIGMVLAVQSFDQFRFLHLETRLGALINMSLVRELGPVLAATMLAGRVGSRVAAELGTMRVTEQIDALVTMGANPLHYLVVPRFLACMFLIPVLTIVADFMGVVGGYYYSVAVLGIDSHHYWENSREHLDNYSLFSGILKSVFFGAAIGMISCYRGFHCEAGAVGVGRAATTAFVHSFIVILILDLFLNIGINNFYNWVWPDVPKPL